MFEQMQKWVAAIRKQVPMQAIKGDGKCMPKFKCPVCGVVVGYGEETDDYCWHCGQKLCYEELIG